MVAIVYARVSSEDQALKGFSLASQVEAGRKRAREMDAGEVVVFSDDGLPGDLLERPGLQGALDMVRARAVAVFVCYDPDRLARSLSLQLLVTDEIERAGVRLEFVNFEYKNTPEGQLFYSLRGAISQYEKAKIRERTMRGKRQKAKTGGLTHNPCIYGYDFDPSTDTLTVNAEQAETVRTIFAWFLEEDLGPWTIAQRLTDVGIPPARGGRGWHHSSVRNILRNESYTGVLHQQKWDYTDTHLNKYRAKGEKVQRRVKDREEWLATAIPAIVDAATYRVAQAKLENARRWWSGWRRDEYLLSGLCRCAVCHRPIYGAGRQSGQRRIRYYVCRGYAPGIPGEPRCAFGRIRGDGVDQEVWAQVRGWILDPSKLQEVLSPARTDQVTREQLAGLRQQLAEVQAEHERTVRLTIRGSISQEMGEQLLREQTQRIKQLQEQMGLLEHEAADSAALAAQLQAVEKVRRQVARDIDNLSFEHRQRLIRALVKAVIVAPDGAVTIHARLKSVVHLSGALAEYSSR